MHHKFSATKICNNIAYAVSDNIKQFGVYVPPGFLKNKRISASMDNNDKKIDTHGGKMSLGYIWCGISCSVPSTAQQEESNNWMY